MEREMEKRDRWKEKEAQKVVEEERHQEGRRQRAKEPRLGVGWVGRRR